MTQTTSPFNEIPIVLQGTCIEYVSRQPTDLERLTESSDKDYYEVKRLKIGIDLSTIDTIKESNDIKGATALINNIGRTFVVEAKFEDIYPLWLQMKQFIYSPSNSE